MKSEKEKMLAGELYNSADEELVSERLCARDLLYEFNNARPRELQKKLQILRRLIRPRGQFYIEAPFYCDYGYNIEVGHSFYANFGCTILDVHRVQIGDNVMLGPNVQIYTATHSLSPAERSSGLESAKPVVIGNNVWIGGSAVICPGVTIGDNVTIGAGSVVTKNIPDSVLAAGNPCRVIKNLES